MSGFQVQIRTRSKVQDYRFVGAQPDVRWWESSYGRWTDFSRPTLIVEPGRFFISGIASQRTDSRGAGIHYALLGKFTTTESSYTVAQFLAWVCTQLAARMKIDELGARLDGISEETWSAALGAEPTAIEEVTAAVTYLIVAPTEVSLMDPIYRKWIGSANRAGMEALALTAARVAIEQQGKAMYLNLASVDELALFRLSSAPLGIVCREGPSRPKLFAPQLGGRSCG